MLCHSRMADLSFLCHRPFPPPITGLRKGQLESRPAQEAAALAQPLQECPPQSFPPGEPPTRHALNPTPPLSSWSQPRIPKTVQPRPWRRWSAQGRRGGGEGFSAGMGMKTTSSPNDSEDNPSLGSQGPGGGSQHLRRSRAGSPAAGAPGWACRGLQGPTLARTELRKSL